jgi:pimeloyl-ACP methyl ester carboxylesterase
MKVLPMPHALHDFGGDGPVLNLAIANGFPPHTYQPLLAPLLGQVHAVSLLPRPLWPDAPPPPPDDAADTWHNVAGDILDGIDAHRLGPVIGVGHSIGGAATLMAAARRPEAFRALILLDPAIFDPDWFAAIDAARAAGHIARTPISEGARKRRTAFPTRQAAFDYWRGRPLFADWTDEALWLYTEGATVPDGDGFRLAWDVGWEAHYFESVYTGTYALIEAVAPRLPMLIVRGELSDTFNARAAAHLRGLAPDADYAEVPGGGHLFPQSHPAAAAAVIGPWLERHLTRTG